MLQGQFVLSSPSHSHPASPSSQGPIVLGRKQKALQKNRSADFNPDFIFTEKEGMYDGSWAMADVMSQLKKKRAATTLDEKIEKVRKKRKTEDKEAKSGKSEKEKEAKEGSEPEEQKDFEGKDEEATEDEESETDYSSADENVLTKAGIFFLRAFVLAIPTAWKVVPEIWLGCSSPLSGFYSAITAMGFKEPTPIQKACIPVGLLGKDICACAATGTGKTAAFALPVLERLIYKPRQAPVTRVLVLVPTRELGIQVHSVTRQLAQFCSVTTCLAVGGLDVKSQEVALRAAPDILIATPGRLIDHLHNCPSFHLSSIEVLILDEADRMLDEYFEEQMKEIIRMCSHHRQTMLFSATMTDEVKDLASVSLKNPVRIFVNSNTDVAPFLRQEFIRIRPNREGDREAIVAALLMRTFTDHVMLFTQTKKQAHRMHILLGLMGLQVGELHGNLSQTQRLEALR
ncbi:putative ATP-dependent RNA helicase DDX27, partial [Eschrichtius robustus]|nr:putative ATP-dependent RNA helicase DDX27 [Eschrichtius robustus]